MKLLDTRGFYKPFKYPQMFAIYKKHQAKHWVPEEIQLSDDVSDWHKRLTEDERVLLTQIFRFFTQTDCFSDDTEVLTPFGWKFIKDVTLEDTVAQVDMDRTLSFVKPLRVVKNKHQGEMYHYKDINGNVDLLVTPNHKMFYTDRFGVHQSTHAKNMLFYQNIKHHTAPSKVLVQEDESNLTPMERLAIAFQADGNVKNDTDGSRLGYRPVWFSFTKKRKIERLHKLLNNAGIGFDFTVNEKGYSVFKTHWPLDQQNYLTKDFCWVNLNSFTKNKSSQFIEEVQHWDSHVDRWGKIIFTNTNKTASDMVQAVGVLAGYTCHYVQYTDPRSEKFNDTFKVTLRPYVPVDGQAIRRGQEIVQYEGDVVCLTVPEGFLLVRRNGKTSISGNCDVLDGYGDLINTFKGHPEVAMCLTNIADRECIHVESYSLLLDTIGIPETEYKAFYEYEEMAAKHEYLQQFGTESYEDIARKLAVTGAFTEGVQLFSSFVILMNFRRFGKMNGMCKVVEFSIKDEDDHVACCIELYKQFVKEYLSPEQVTKVTEDLIGMCRKTVDLEDKFVDLAFNTANNNIEGLTKEEVKQYIRFMANLRLTQLGLDPIYNVMDNPLPWLDWVVYGKGHTNFFENRETEYSKGALQGEWNEVEF
jgi:ribonucleoside-diphosphate reductase beta chain